MIDTNRMTNMLIGGMIEMGMDDRSIVEFFAPMGSANQAQWRCDDGYIVSYTTSRVFGGKYHDKFAVMLYKPIGKGARSGKPKEWHMVYERGFATRKSAKKRAEQLWEQHRKK